MSISPSLLIETFYPQVLTTTDDGFGGVSTTLTDGTAFKGRLSRISSAERVGNDKVSLESTHKLFCNYQVISPTSRIRNDDSTRYFNIKGIIDPSNLHDHLELYVAELD